MRTSATFTPSCQPGLRQSKLQLDSSNKAMQNKLSMIKELIAFLPRLASGRWPRFRRQQAHRQKQRRRKRPLLRPRKRKWRQHHPPPAATAPAAAASKPAESPPEAAPAKAVPSKVTDTEAQAAVENEIAKLVENWASAWSRKDVNAYLAFYGKDFQTPKGNATQGLGSRAPATDRQTREAAGQRRGIKVTVNGNTATVRFRQNYASPSLKSSTGKRCCSSSRVTTNG